jgi:DNA-binding FadR family transcriptional regulator
MIWRFGKKRGDRIISDNIVAQIKNAIFTETYKPGDKLPSEQELKSLFNTSRIPLREALRSLEEMGLITVKHGVSGGAFVAQMGIKSVTDSLSNMIRLGKIGLSEIWEFRMLVEPSISALAAKRRTEWDIKQLEEMVALRENAVKVRKTPAVANIDFHQAIARATQNSLVILIVDTVGEVLLESLKRLNFSLSDHKSITKLHRNILECIKKKDARRVEDLMYTHLTDVKRRLRIEGIK